MANLKTGGARASIGAIGDIDTAQRNPLGMLQTTDDNNVFVYLPGVAAAAAGTWVSYNASTYVPIVLVADAVGFVAISTAAILAVNWGWFQVYGFNTVSKSDTVAAAGGLFIDGTAGRVDDASVAGDMIYGAMSTGADTANVLPVHINYPYVTNTVPA